MSEAFLLHDIGLTFEDRSEYWFSRYSDVLPADFLKRNMSAIDDSEEKRIIEAYDEGDDDFGFLILGPSGVGKTFTLCALLNKILLGCYKYECSMLDTVAYFPVSYLLYKLRSQRDPPEYKKCLNVKFLFLDDLGVENTTDFAREHFFSILDLRCQKRQPTFIASNLNFNELKEKYGERTVSRLKEMCVPLQIKGNDRRSDLMKEKIEKLKGRIKR